MDPLSLYESYSLGFGGWPNLGGKAKEFGVLRIEKMLESESKIAEALE